MSNPSTPRRVQDCTRILAELEAGLARPKEISDEWVRRTQREFGRFAGNLRSQFEGEEQGLYRELPGKFPHVTTRLEQLREEHVGLLRNLDRVIETVRSLEAPVATDIDVLRDRTRSLKDALLRHETREAELLQSAYWREVGAGD